MVINITMGAHAYGTITLKMYKNMNSLVITAPVREAKKPVSKVPPFSLPFLELKNDPVIEKKIVEIFDSVYDYCSQFQAVQSATN